MVLWASFTTQKPGTAAAKCTKEADVEAACCREYFLVWVSHHVPDSRVGPRVLARLHQPSFFQRKERLPFALSALLSWPAPEEMPGQVYLPSIYEVAEVKV